MSYDEDKDEESVDDVEPHFFVPSKEFPVFLERSNKHVTLTREEWKTLNRFAGDIESVAAIKPEHYQHFSKNVQKVIRDWVLCFRYP